MTLESLKKTKASSSPPDISDWPLLDLPQRSSPEAIRRGRELLKERLLFEKVYAVRFPPPAYEGKPEEAHKNEVLASRIARLGDRSNRQAGLSTPLEPIKPAEWAKALPRAVEIIHGANSRSRIPTDAAEKFTSAGAKPMLEATNTALSEVLGETVESWEKRLGHKGDNVKWFLFMDKGDDGKYNSTVAIMRVGHEGYVCRLATADDSDGPDDLKETRKKVNIAGFLHRVMKYMHNQGVSQVYDQTYPESYLIKNYHALGFRRIERLEQHRFRERFLPVLRQFGLNPPKDMVDLVLELSTVDLQLNDFLTNHPLNRR